MHSRPLLSKYHRQRLMRLFSLLSILGVTLAWLPARPVDAGVLSTVRDYLSRQQAGITTGIQHEVFFTATTAVSGGAGINKVIVILPSDSANNTKWCRTAGTLTVTGITEPTGTFVTAESATALPGTLAGTCSQTADTFNITGVNNLTAATKYGVRFVGLVGVLGTGDAANNIKILVKTNNGTADVDTYTVATSLVAADQYALSASVDPTLTVALSATTLNLGTLTSTNVSYQGVTSTVTTNAANGYVSLVNYSGALSNGTDTIADAGGTATAGTSGFGASTSKASQTISASTASPACTTTLQTQTGSANATTLATAFKQFSSAAAAASADATTLCFLAAVSGTQAPGAYSTTVTLVTTAKF